MVLKFYKNESSYHTVLQIYKMNHPIIRFLEFIK
jgi:hypothetical protein